MESKTAQDLQKVTLSISAEELEEVLHKQALHNKLKLEEDFLEGILHLKDYSGIRLFKSIRRAIKRGHVSIHGDVYPKRPFKNTKAKKGSITYDKRRYYEQCTHKKNKQN